MEDYARRHNYEFRVIERDEVARTGHWLKIEAIRETLDAPFDFILWVDTAALIGRKYIDGRSAIKPVGEINLVWHDLVPEIDGDPAHFNAGVMLIRVSDWSRTFFTQVWKTGDLQHKWSDQATILHLLGYDDILGIGPARPRLANRKHIAKLDIAWNSIVGVAVGDDPIIHHYAGAPRSSRSRLLAIDGMTIDYRARATPGVRREFLNLFASQRTESRLLFLTTATLADVKDDLARKDDRINQSEAEMSHLPSHAAEDKMALRRQITALQGQLIAVQRQVGKLHAGSVGAAAREAGLQESHQRYQTELAVLDQNFKDIRASTSWRITRPLRFAGHRGRWLAQGTKAWLTLQPGTWPRRVARRLVNWLNDRGVPVGLPGNRAGFSQPRQIDTAVSDATGPHAGKKVAVLAPVSVSGIEGGAERFHRALARALRAQGCQVELLSIPFDESSFKAIKRGYKYFSKLELGNFDLVISTKAPTYMANHPNHVLYLQHTIRVFYDMFDEAFPDADDVLKQQRAWIIAQDTAALSRIRHRFSQGLEVSRRLSAWNDCDAELLYPPIEIDGLHNAGIGDYFYMPGRLHAWKRIDLAIRAIKLSTLPMRLVISGVGDAEGELRALAGDDPRIEFRGRVGDETLKQLYAGALAVPFLPVREDYGYVTLEAFASGKPVVTCTDSGEPTVFVRDGITGLVCEPRPQAISDAFERLWNDREFAARLGEAGRQSSARMTWSAVAKRLLEAGFPDVEVPATPAKPQLKVAVLDMQPIIPAVGGGRLRLLGLYHALGNDIQTRYVGTYDWPGEGYRRHFISPTLEEIDVPLSSAHYEAAKKAAGQAGGKTVIDLMFAQQANLSPDYLKETLAAVAWADVVVFSHPWVAPLVGDELLAGKTVIYDSHNVEAELRRQLLDLTNPFEQSVLKKVCGAEKLAGDRADLILACSDADGDAFATRYGWPRQDIRVVPNGVFIDVVRPATTEQKRRAREQLNLPQDAFIGFFIGTDFAPNVEAGRFIVEQLAAQLPDIVFGIGGGVCNRLPMGLPANVRLAGILEQADKANWLHACDFAVNPMFSGSGTNIKMFDFMAAGLPVVATPIGARGIAEQSTAGLWLAESGQLAGAVRELSLDRTAALDGGRFNRTVVEANYAWESTSPHLGDLDTQHAQSETRHSAAGVHRRDLSRLRSGPSVHHRTQMRASVSTRARSLQPIINAASQICCWQDGPQMRSPRLTAWSGLRTSHGIMTMWNGNRAASCQRRSRFCSISAQLI